MVRAGVIANTAVGQFNGEVIAGERGSALRLAARGSVGWLAGLPFASRVTIVY